MNSIRTLTLHKGLTYSIGNYKFLKDVPLQVDDDMIYSRLLRNPAFEENPPISLHRVTKPGYKILTRYQFLNSPKEAQNTEIKPFYGFEIPNSNACIDILVSRDMGAGDVIIVTDLLRNIRLNFPNCHLTFATNFAYIPLVNNLDFIDKVVQIGTVDAREYDIAVNLCDYSEFSPYYKTKHRADIYGDALSDDFPWVERKTSLQIHPECATWFYNYNAYWNKDDKPIVVLQPEASCNCRSFDPGLIIPLIKQLISREYFVYIPTQDHVWSFQFKHYNTEILDFKIVDDQSLENICAIIANSKCVIGPDSSGYHIASAFGVPSIVWFNSIDHRLRTRDYPKCYPIQSKLQCSPCWDRPCGNGKSLPCQKEMDVNEILEIFNREIR